MSGSNGSTVALDVVVTPVATGVTVGAASELAVVVDLVGRGSAVGGPRPSLSVSFVLDASGSMGGDPLQQVKASVDRLIESLAPTDSVAVVAFANNPTVLAEKAPLTVAHKAALRRRLNTLTADGGTGMTAGLQAGAKALGSRSEGERQVVILLTDGAPTDGATAATLGAIAASLRPDISTTTLGYGVNHQADLLLAVAAAGGGQYWYIPDPDEAELEFARALGAQGDIVVDGIELVLQPEEGVEIVEVVDAPRTRVTAAGLVVPRPDLRDAQTHSTILKLRIDSQMESRRLPILSVQVRFRRAGSSVVENVVQRVSIDVGHGRPQKNLDAARKVALSFAEQRRVAARHEADQGRFEAGAKILRAVVAELEALPGYQKLDGSPVSEAVEQVIDEIQAYETKPSAEQYKEFRSTNLAVDLAQGAVHAADVRGESVIAKQLMAGVVGGVHIGDVVMTEKGSQAEQRFPLTGELTVGRVQGNDIVIPRGNVSKRHTRFAARNGKAIVVDLKSTNGTSVNNKRITSPAVLGEDDRVYIGDYTLRFEPKKP